MTVTVELTQEFSHELVTCTPLPSVIVVVGRLGASAEEFRQEDEKRFASMVAFLVGYGSHLLVDTMTLGGVQLSKFIAPSGPRSCARPIADP